MQKLQTLTARVAQSNIARGIVAAGTALAVSAANAAVDVTSTVSDLGDVKTAVASIGVAVLAIAVGIKLYKWVKSAL